MMQLYLQSGLDVKRIVESFLEVCICRGMEVQYYNRMLNVEFNWDMNGLTSVESIQKPLPLIDHGAVKKAIGKMNNGNATDSSSIL